ncbi:MAG: leucine-rich repeat domain-containing protein [Ruminococcus sp.]|nr:leucine-rich repeat domain-containing protein [Ruminococcus sp.]
MYKRIISCTAALMLAAGGLGALPVSDISASAVEIDASKVKTWGDFKYIVWDFGYGDEEYASFCDPIEIVDYKITGDSIAFPDEIDGKPVCFIDSERLKKSAVKMVTLPSSFCRFYDHSGSPSNSYEDNREELADALGECKFLEYVDIHSDTYDSKDGIVYSNNYWDPYGDFDEWDYDWLYFVPPMISSYTFPKDVRRVGRRAFYGNRKIKSLTIPSTVECISEGMFENCISLKKVVMNNKVLSGGVREDTFRGCTALESVTLPESIEYIGPHAFLGCKSLESIKIPENTRYIERGAFLGCSSLENVELGKGVLRIYEDAFTGLSNLKSLRIPESIQQIDDGSVGMYWDEGELLYLPISGFKLYCYPGVGEKYAKASGLDYELVATPMKKAKITLVDGTKYAYTGKVIKPKVKVTYKGKTLKKGTDYRIAYQGLKDPGKRVLTVIGLNDFSGKVKVNFIIVPKASTLTKLTSPKKKAVKLTWKRDKTCDGYQLITSYRKDFKKKAKVVVIKNNKTVAKTITGLKSGKRVYAKVRAYTTVDGKRVYGKCSKVKNIICK